MMIKWGVYDWERNWCEVDIDYTMEMLTEIQYNLIAQDIWYMGITVY